MINGEVKEYHLCDECAREVEMEKLFPEFGQVNSAFENLLSSLWGSFVPEKTSPHYLVKSKTVSCPKCGLDLAGFQESGKFGCAQCYETFKEYIGPLVRKIHGADVHRGLRPGRRRAVKGAPVDELSGLRRELQEAVEKEEYERAAQLRDRIRALEERSGHDA